MKLAIPCMVLVCFLLPGAGGSSSPVETKAAASAKVNTDTQEKTWAAFEITELLERRARTNRPYLKFLEVPTLSTGVYVLPAGSVDRQGPHREDEVYYIVSGRAVLRVGEKEDQSVDAGSVVYVKAGVPHRFHSITEGLTVLVFFSRSPGSGMGQKNQ